MVRTSPFVHLRTNTRAKRFHDLLEMLAGDLAVHVDADEDRLAGLLRDGQGVFPGALPLNLYRLGPVLGGRGVPHLFPSDAFGQPVLLRGRERAGRESGGEQDGEVGGAWHGSVSDGLPAYPNPGGATLTRPHSGAKNLVSEEAHVSALDDFYCQRVPGFYSQVLQDLIRIVEDIHKGLTSFVEEIDSPRR